MSEAYNINKDLIETLCSNLLEESIETEQLGRSETFFQDWDGAESYKTILKFKKNQKNLSRTLFTMTKRELFIFGMMILLTIAITFVVWIILLNILLIILLNNLLLFITLINTKLY